MISEASLVHVSYRGLNLLEVWERLRTDVANIPHT